MKKIIGVISFLAIFGHWMPFAGAQSALDIYRISDQRLLGTARAAGTNTNMTGIGADFTTLSANPAGIAQFRLSELVISPTVQVNSISSLLNGNDANTATDETKVKMRLPNIGMVFAKQSEKNRNLNFAFGVGLNGYVSNNYDFSYTGKSDGSIQERFEGWARGNDYGTDPFESDLAEDVGIFWTDSQGTLERDPDGSLIYDYKDFRGTHLDKFQFVNSNGRYSELALSAGFNAGNKLLAGVTIGVPIYRFNESKTYQERDDDGAVTYFEELVFKEYKTSRGIGINAKLGLIYKPVNSILIGATVASPSFVKITDVFNTSLEYTYLDNQLYNGYAESPEGTIDYNVRTPLKLGGSVGAIFGKNGFLNAEVEYQDFSKSNIKIKSDNIADRSIQDDINREIGLNYRSVLRFNMGGEIAIPFFRFRAGYGLSQSPFVGETGFLPSFGLGLGFKGEKMFVDLAYRQWRSNNGYDPFYFVFEENQKAAVNQKVTDRAIIATIGFNLY